MVSQPTEYFFSSPIAKSPKLYIHSSNNSNNKNKSPIPQYNTSDNKDNNSGNNSANNSSKLRNRNNNNTITSPLISVPNINKINESVAITPDNNNVGSSSFSCTTTPSLLPSPPLQPVLPPPEAPSNNCSDNNIARQIDWDMSLSGPPSPSPSSSPNRRKSIKSVTKNSSSSSSSSSPLSSLSAPKRSPSSLRRGNSSTLNPSSNKKMRHCISTLLLSLLLISMVGTGSVSIWLLQSSSSSSPSSSGSSSASTVDGVANVPAFHEKQRPNLYNATSRQQKTIRLGVEHKSTPTRQDKRHESLLHHQQRQDPIIHSSSSTGGASSSGQNGQNEDTGQAADDGHMKKESSYPRVIFYSYTTGQSNNGRQQVHRLPISQTPNKNKFTSIGNNENNTTTAATRILMDDLTLHAPPGEEAAEQDNYIEKLEKDNGDCIPMSSWQTLSFPTCNNIHEQDLMASGIDVGLDDMSEQVSFEDNLHLLGSGWFRHTWKLDRLYYPLHVKKHNNDDDESGRHGQKGEDEEKESVVLKTLRLEREFYTEFYDLHRKDAIAMERLTHSPYVMDIYGYCGQSVINELANFPNPALTNLEKFDRQLRGRNDFKSNVYKLQLGYAVAKGVADIHNIDYEEGKPSNMVHYDLNPRNVAIVKGGIPKLNDFNIAEFLYVNPKRNNETCGFPSRMHLPWWRSPEEVYEPKKFNVTKTINGTDATVEEREDAIILNEKIDVYSLGNLLHHILTSHSPRGKLDKKKRIETVRASILNGEPPPLNEFYVKSTDPSIIAFRKAMSLCFVKDPAKRGTSLDVANILLTTLKQIQRQRQQKQHNKESQKKRKKKPSKHHHKKL